MDFLIVSSFYFYDKWNKIERCLFGCLCLWYLLRSSLCSGFCSRLLCPLWLVCHVYLWAALHGFCLLCMGLAEKLSTVLKPLSLHKWLLFLLTHLPYFSLSTISFKIFSPVPWEFLATCFDLYPLQSQTRSFLYPPNLVFCFTKPTKSNLCCPNTSECVVLHCGVLDLLGALLLLPAPNNCRELHH